MKSLLWIMKFVYKYADKDDLEVLYQRVVNADLKLPLKQFNVTSAPAKLLRPLAVVDYTKVHDPKKTYRGGPSQEEDLKHKIAMTRTDFRPTITDVDVCSSYNARSVMDVFNPKAVIAFHETFEDSRKNITRKDAGMKEYTFIIDSQKRRQYPHNQEEDDGFLARFVFSTFCLNKFETIIFDDFSISINTPDEFYNVLQNSIDIEPGTEMLIRVQPVQLESEDGIRSEPIEQRKCRFEDEVPKDMPLFKIYSRNACLFNCMYQFR